MRFLSDHELKEIYNASLKVSQYESVNNFIKDLWSKFVLSGYSDLPIGFLARLTEKILHISQGENKFGNSNIINKINIFESKLIEIISKSQGFKQIEGEFIISGNKFNKEKLYLSFEKIFDKIPVFSHHNLKFTAKDLEKALELDIKKVDKDYYSELENIYEKAIEQASMHNDLIDEEDLFQIRNPQLFLSDQRALKLYRLMNNAIKNINFYLIGEVTLKPENDYVISKYGEEQVLSVGGYDSLINRGDISSLLPSELAYIDKNEKIDYFDYKYMQKELLYYKREEGSIFRMRRVILVDIEIDYAVEHEKNLALVFAFCISLIEKLVSVFTKDIIQIYLVFSGKMPSSIDYALSFLKHFIEKQKYDENIFIIEQKQINTIFEKNNFQNWTIGKKQYKKEKFINFSFPSFDIINSMDYQNRTKTVANTINNIIEELVKIADS